MLGWLFGAVWLAWFVLDFFRIDYEWFKEHIHMRVRMVQDYEELIKGQTVRVSMARAKLLLKSGAAIQTKDVVRGDTKVK